MGCIHKFVIYGSFILFLQAVSGDSLHRWRRQTRQLLPSLQPPRPPAWVPLPESQRFVRQDPGAVRQTFNGGRNPPLNLPVRQPERNAIPQLNNAVRQQPGVSSASGGWIPLAPQLDSAINLVEDDNRIRQFNPIVSLPDAPGKRVPVTAVDPLLFSRDQSVLLPSTRQPFEDFFNVKPTQVFINEPLRPTSVVAAPERPAWPSISVQSIPARVNENRRPVFSGKTTTISPLRIPDIGVDGIPKPVLPVVRADPPVQETGAVTVSVLNLGSNKLSDESVISTTQAVTLPQSPASETTPKTESTTLTEIQATTLGKEESIITTTEQKDLVFVTAATEGKSPLPTTILETSPTTPGLSTTTERKLPSLPPQTERIPSPKPKEDQLLTPNPVRVQSELGIQAEQAEKEKKTAFALDVPVVTSDGATLIVEGGPNLDDPLILGPSLFSVVSNTTERIIAFDDSIRIPEFGLDVVPKLVDSEVPDKVNADLWDDETERTIVEGNDGVSDVDVSDAKELLEDDAVAEGDETALAGVPNGHQGPAGDLEDSVENSSDRNSSVLTVNHQRNSSSSDNEEKLVDSAEEIAALDNEKVMNGHQSPIFPESPSERDPDLDSTDPTVESEQNDYDYNISPPGLVVSFPQDFNVSLVDFGNGTFVLENKTYVFDPASALGHSNNETNNLEVQLESERESPPENRNIESNDDVKQNETNVLSSSEGPDISPISVPEVIPTSEKTSVETGMEGEVETPTSENKVIVDFPGETQNVVKDVSEETQEVIKDVPEENRNVFNDNPEDTQNVAKDAPEQTHGVASDVPEEIENVAEEIPVETQDVEENVKETTVQVSTSPSLEIVEVVETSVKPETTAASSRTTTVMETSRELGTRTTPLATIISSIISSFRPQTPDNTTPGITTEKEITTTPPTITTPRVPVTAETTVKVTPQNTERPEVSSQRSEVAADGDSFENSLEPEPKVPLYVRISLDITWKELCANIDTFRATLAHMVSKDSQISSSISPRQIVIYNIARCAMEIHNSRRRRRRISEPVTALCYVTDYHGVYSHRLTDALVRSLNSSSHGAMPLAEKIVAAEPVTSSPDSLTIGTHQHVPTTGMIAGITVAAIVGLSVVAFLVFLLVVRRRQHRATYARRCEPGGEFGIRNSIRNLSWRQSKSQLRGSKRSFMNYAYEDPNAPTRPVNSSRLHEIDQDLASLEKEFKQIPSPATTLDDLPPGVESKNRFSNVIPVPDTRVLLKPIGGDESSEYINANYVRGPRDEPQYYIACQAPMEATVPDFWRMIWEKQSKLIIQLTELFENGSSKCADYLPPSEVLDCHRLYGDFQVTLKKRELKQGYIISFVTLKHMNDNLTRDVVHYWYTGWPHTGVPEDPKQLVVMLTESRTAVREGSSPIVVHCCPGTGRTGTVIAIDLLMRVADAKKPVDVPRSVYKLRRDRTGCVQTKEQYQFIYQALTLHCSSLLSADVK